MSSQQQGSLRVLVCGTTFGQVYLEALQAPGIPFKLAGILAQGSQRSRSCSAFYAVPLFTSVEELPPDIDVACVVVRSSLLGGAGTELAQSLMARGVHVLQEHPVHHDELAACLRQAHRWRVQYHLNSFYPHLSPVRRFLRAAQSLVLNHRASYIHAACSLQVSYALLDILRIALGKVRPWSFAAASELPDIHSMLPEQIPFKGINGVFAGVPLSLQIQNQIHPTDPDDYSYLLHRITLGTEAGELTLVSTHGPLIWSARPAIPREVRDGGANSLFAAAAVPNDDTCTALLGPGEQPSQRRLFGSIWPAAVRRALFDLRHSIQNAEDPLRRGQHDLTLCRVWRDITNELGPPQLVRSEVRPRPLSAEELAGMRAAGSEPND